jgi:hypothetical protein
VEEHDYKYGGATQRADAGGEVTVFGHLQIVVHTFPIRTARRESQRPFSRHA